MAAAQQVLFKTCAVHIYTQIFLWLYSNLIEVIYKILNVGLKVFHNGEVMDMSIDVSNQW